MMRGRPDRFQKPVRSLESRARLGPDRYSKIHITSLWSAIRIIAPLRAARRNNSYCTPEGIVQVQMNFTIFKICQVLTASLDFSHTKIGKVSILKFELIFCNTISLKYIIIFSAK